MNSNRYGESRAAYREVQERHQDIKRIEQTIAELAQLFNDVRLLFNISHAVLMIVIDECNGRATGRNHKHYPNNCCSSRQRHRSGVGDNPIHAL